MSNTNSPRFGKSTRVQTTVSILEEAIAGVDALAVASGVSRSRLMDLAVRRFLRWSANMEPQDLQLIAEYEVTEPISGFARKSGSGTQAAYVLPEEPRAKVLSSSAPPAPPPSVEDTGPVTPRRAARVPVETPPRVRDRHGRYSDTPGRGR